jgi:hypothetical protein
MKQPKQAEIEAARLIFIGLMKALSEHSTFLTGEFKMKLKQDFNVLVNHCDHLIADLENRLNDSQKEYLQQVTDVYHNINIEMRNGAVKKYEQLMAEES